MRTDSHSTDIAATEPDVREAVRVTEPVAAPSVLFVCVKNGGKSQMAAALMTQVSGDAVTVSSAGTQAGSTVNDLSARVLTEVGADITGNRPTQLTADMVAAADLVVVLGRDAQVTSDLAPVRVWDTDEPSERGIDGIERMRLVRDDIAARVRDLHAQLVHEHAEDRS